MIAPTSTPTSHHITPPMTAGSPNPSMRLCASCHNVLLPADAVSIKGNFYHPMCVVCSECRAPLSSLDNYEDGKFYCDVHYQKFVRTSAPRSGDSISRYIIEETETRFLFDESR